MKPARRHAGVVLASQAPGLAQDSPPVPDPQSPLVTHPPALTAIPTANDLAKIADRCVRCGLCLPHCPTYRLARQEAESPRGRIALIQAWAEGVLDNTPALQRHLDTCLECLACERACPTLVPFASLMDGARAEHWRHQPAWRRGLRQAWLALLASPGAASVIGAAGQLYRGLGLARLVAGTGLSRWPGIGALHRLAQQVEGLPRIPPVTTARVATDGRVGLFLGCIARAAQPGAIAASVQVLQRLGQEVVMPPRQTCCGGMHRHNGLPRVADDYLEANAKAFTDLPVVGLASACVAELRAQPHLAATQEICRLLADLDWPATVPLRPLPGRIAIHVPCSHRNRLRDAQAARDLLRRIPDVELIDLPENDLCCGAAGTYLLQQPKLSQALLRPKLAHLAASGARILVTTNTGCALHLAAGVREAGLAVEVLHPVEVIARQLEGWEHASDGEEHSLA